MTVHYQTCHSPFLDRVSAGSYARHGRLQKEARIMRFVKVKDEERTGDVAINLDLIREAHFGGGLLHLYFERGSSTQDDITFTGENAQKIWAAMG